MVSSLADSLSSKLIFSGSRLIMLSLIMLATIQYIESFAKYIFRSISYSVESLKSGIYILMHFPKAWAKAE